MKVLIVDNYDSFTYNLFHYISSLGVGVDVLRNDALDFELIKSDYSHLILSPGPGLPEESVNLLEVIERFHSTKPILGVCLGMQALAISFGGTLKNQDAVKHGVQEQVFVHGKSQLFHEIPNRFNVGLYHSWKVDRKNIPNCFELIAVSEHQVAMAIQHKELPLFGVQFHPESILSEYGLQLLKNFLAVK